MTYSSEDQLDPRREDEEAAAAAPPPQRKPLDSDEWIAILVAFGVIGTIFFWSIRPQNAARSNGSWLRSGIGLVNDDSDSSNQAGFGLVPETDESEAIAGTTSALLDGETGRLTSPSSASAIRQEADRTGLLSRRTAGTAAVAGAAVAGAAGADGAESVTVPAIPAASPAPVAETETTSPTQTDIVAEPIAEAEPAPPTETEPPAAAAPPLEVASEALETSVPEIAADAWVAPFAESLAAADRFGELPTQTDGFDIDQPVTRAEFAALLNQAEQANGDPAAAASEFADIDATFWGASGIAGAKSTGFMSGYSTPNGLAFRPSEAIPRWQVFVTMASGLGLEIPADPDAVLSAYNITGVPDWAKGQVAATVQEGLAINPNSTTDLEASRSTTRGEATAMIQQVLQRENKVEAVDASPFVVRAAE